MSSKSMLVVLLTPNEFNRTWRRKKFTDRGMLRFNEHGFSFSGSLNSFTSSKAVKINVVRRPFYWTSLIEKLIIPVIVYLLCLLAVLTISHVPVYGLQSIFIIPTIIVILGGLVIMLVSLRQYFQDQWLEVQPLDNEESEVTIFYLSTDKASSDTKEQFSYLREELLGFLGAS